MSTLFSASGVPELVFGRGVFEKLARQVLPFGTRVLLIGDAYLKDHPSLLKEVSDMLQVQGIAVSHISALGKKTSQASQAIMDEVDLSQIDCVISLGGGRAIDTGKLVARDCPHIAVPTTAGTGAPMNGVVFGGDGAIEETSRTSLLPTIVCADPSFLDEMDRDDFAARSLAVLMLLVEAYVSPKASVLSDALVWSGLESFVRGFVKGIEGDQKGRDEVFYASLMAGVGSGQAGFGLSHRLGVSVEQETELTYAQSCATICAEISHAQIEMLAEFLPDHSAMDKYALVGELLAERPFEDREEAYASLVGTLRRWVARLELPKLPLSEKKIEEITQLIIADWDEEVLPVRLSHDVMIDALLRRHIQV
ncbi:putative Iron-containing alcohol dehydrogenase [Candidatus Terasakiella magnetica]|uniref:Putative Iron-containing alcohol dehydrogenase n=1 Tax=Candidatus Terasakiella magnetica TaxID=1867952 RepID=A0A1C3RM52_9PROT|nr:iron-containing alcohol dehydrogenase [Candidatus Terasakiella magnetica]SCA58189.1 putative Iron-containing alcohol dehydrogenase [Candidatus Terasakiella magnetica]